MGVGSYALLDVQRGADRDLEAGVHVGLRSGAEAVPGVGHAAVLHEVGRGIERAQVRTADLERSTKK